MGPVGIYIHFPFCISKCYYCGFNSVPYRKEQVEAYLPALAKELEGRLASGWLRDKVVTTVYFGGGTPSLMGPAQVERLYSLIGRQLNLEKDVEVTLEANPDLPLNELGNISTPETFCAFRQAGVTRLVVGVQSFDDGQLKALGRTYTGEQAKEAVAAAGQVGFASLGLDLIFALPGQEYSCWGKDLTTAMALHPDHLSLYSLTLEPGSRYGQWRDEGRFCLPGQEVFAEMFLMGHRLLTREGYEHYEVSNYARVGHHSRHNLIYWQRGEYLGLGAGAHSFLKPPGEPYGLRLSNHPNIDRYLALLNTGKQWFSQERLTFEEALGETLFLRLRTSAGMDLEELSSAFHLPWGEKLKLIIEELVRKKKLKQQGSWVKPTAQGMLVAEELAVRFLAALT